MGNATCNVAQPSCEQSFSLRKRYRNVAISIAVFLALVSGLMYYGYSISVKIQKNQVQIDAAGTLSDTFYDILTATQELQISSLEQNVERKALAANPEQMQLVNSKYITQQIEKQKWLEERHKTAEDLIRILDKGGAYDIVEGVERIMPLEIKETRNSLDAVEAIWGEYRSLLSQVTAYPADSGGNADFAKEVSEFAAQNQEAIYDNIDEIIVRLNENIIEYATLQKNVQIAGIGLSVLYFLFFMGFFMRRLTKSDQEAAKVRRENLEILQAVNSGLFLLDKNLNIGSQYSQELEHLWGKRDFGGQNMLSVLSDMVSNPDDLEVAGSFIRQLYNPRTKEKLIGSLNPFIRSPMIVTNQKGVKETRYLDFKFNRVYHDNEIARVLVSVTDETDSVLLADKITKERKQNDLQMEMLSFILNADAKLLTDFIDTAKKRNNSINEVLKQPVKAQADFFEKLHVIFREVHGLKGDASSLNLHGFVTIAERLEENLKDLQGRKTLNGEDFLMLTVSLEELFNLTQTIEDLNNRINKATEGGRHSPLAARHIQNPEPMKGQLNKYVQELAERNGKKVDFSCEGMDNPRISMMVRSQFKELAVQLLRNAVVHGVEIPQVRKQKHKLESGHIRLALVETENTFRLDIQDDGTGIDTELIRTALVKQNMYSEEEAAKLDKQALIQKIFMPGFSTAINKNEDAGRGVGMDLVNDRIRKLKGKVSISTRVGAYTCITLSIPNKF
ncbi:ATP-binding protein [Neisseria montereyensis]|uniref:histidine kinase n=1 Tax=Neisseria montereyensis TaxID=2973938 RepID=A0ABT2FB15_9NEIS|nr:ATP-binding protein [Neisseria montereyensis]MCS4533333.1 ATP-binding protein [Neisseria montereyensis]